MSKSVMRYRPDDWDNLVKGLVEDCIKAGEVDIDETNRPQVEGFIRYCIGVGADAMLEGIRAYGVDALVRNRKILLVLSKVSIPGRPQYRDPGMSFKDKAGYSGPGKISFIPNDISLEK